MQHVFKHGDPPPSCQHYRIDHTNGRCVECDEQMIGVEVTPETVLSAPNLTACKNPACVAALKNGTYDDADPPPGCSNRHGMYIPDRSRETEVTLGWHYSYECERCRNDGTIMRHGEPIIWECGKSHRAYVAARESR